VHEKLFEDISTVMEFARGKADCNLGQARKAQHLADLVRLLEEVLGNNVPEVECDCHGYCHEAEDEERADCPGNDPCPIPSSKGLACQGVQCAGGSDDEEPATRGSWKLVD